MPDPNTWSEWEIKADFSGGGCSGGVLTPVAYIHALGPARYGAVCLKSFYRCGVIVVGRLGVESRELIELRHRSEAD